jgi:cytochrome c biogenesis protein CcdA
MRYGTITGLLIASFLYGSVFSAQDKPRRKLVLHFFGSSTCGECNTIKYELLQPLEKIHADKLSIEFHDSDNDKDFQLSIKFEDAFHVQESSPQELFFPDTFLLGFDDIMKWGKLLIEDRLNKPEKWNAAVLSIDSTTLKSDIGKRLERFSFWAITGAGLLDGINPCAIATLIFLVSFLATQKRRRSEIIIIGIFFTAAVYVTYILIGIGIFKTLTFLEQYHRISQFIRWGAVIFAAGVGLLSLYDAFAYKKTGKTESIINQLPTPVKMKIHSIISVNLRGSQLVTGALITGFLVTLFEAVCTGQVYVPTIIVMTKASGFKLHGWLYLVYYNILFVLPLMLVIILAYFGMKWNELAKITQKNLILLKILIGLLMLSLAGFLVVAG